MTKAVWIAICLFSLTGFAWGQTGPMQGTEPSTMSSAEIRELLDAARATAKATRENVDYARVVPDVLFQILAKLDKVEDKLDKIEEAIKQNQNPRTKAR